MTVFLPCLIIGAVLCLVEGTAAAAAKGGWRVWPARLIPVAALIYWAAMLAHGVHNNPGGWALLVGTVGIPLLLCGGAGLLLGRRLGKRGR